MRASCPDDVEACWPRSQIKIDHDGIRLERIHREKRLRCTGASIDGESVQLEGRRHERASGVVVVDKCDARKAVAGIHAPMLVAPPPTRSGQDASGVRTGRLPLNVPNGIVR